MGQAPLLRASALSKSFPGVRALAEVDFDLHAGEVHALVGENGAGKSTFVKVLGGGIVPDTGEVLLDGAPLAFGDPFEARRRRIDIIYQEFTLVPQLTAAENIFLGRERGRFVLKAAEMRRDAQRLLDRLGAKVDPRDIVETLGVAQQQMVEIARALAGDPRVLVLDEPTASLSDRETARLFDILRDLRASGLGIVYISHRLSEIFAIADRVTVLRDGRRITTSDVAGLDRGQLIRWMVGRDLADEFPRRAAAPEKTVDPPLLELRHFSAPPYFSDVSLTVGSGEIVGLAGLVGAGRTSVALALLGAIGSSGEVRINGATYRPSRPRKAMAAGLAYVTEDRARGGVFPLLSACANTTITELGSFSRAGFLSRAREETAAGRVASAVGFARQALDQAAGALSGGNQQKLLIARNLLAPPRILIMDEPTRGIDIGAKREIYDVMNRLTAGGIGILMISSELPEVLGMADRIVVMREGRTMGELARAEATPERVMHLATLDDAARS
jgi:ABC-type sugar transport system ATPase subunit